MTAKVPFMIGVQAAIYGGNLSISEAMQGQLHQTRTSVCMRCYQVFGTHYLTFSHPVLNPPLLTLNLFGPHNILLRNLTIQSETSRTQHPLLKINPLINLIASDTSSRSQLPIPFIVAVAEPLAIRIDIEIEGTRVRPKGGSRVEVGAIDVDGWGEGDVFAAAIFGAVELRVAPISAVDVEAENGGFEVSDCAVGQRGGIWKVGDVC